MSKISSNAHFPQAKEVLAFWLQDGMQLGWPSQDPTPRWFRGGVALDQEIRTRFGPLVQEAQARGLPTWADLPLDRLALVILLDQFSRNVFRGKPMAFAGEARAQLLVMDACAKGWDSQLPLAGRVFMYLPLMHAEDLRLQDHCVRAIEAALEAAPPKHRTDVQTFLKSAIKHRDIIAKFGRFPHRNETLGRTPTAGEQGFLRTGPRFGQ